MQRPAASSACPSACRSLPSVSTSPACRTALDLRISDAYFASTTAEAAGVFVSNRRLIRPQRDSANQSALDPVRVEPREPVPALKKFDVRKGCYDHEERIAVLHTLLRRFGSQQPDTSGCIRTRVWHCGLSKQRFDDRSSKRFCQHLQFVARTECAATSKDDDSFSRI